MTSTAPYFFLKTRTTIRQSRRIETLANFLLRKTKSMWRAETMVTVLYRSAHTKTTSGVSRTIKKEKREKTKKPEKKYSQHLEMWRPVPMFQQNCKDYYDKLKQGFSQEFDELIEQAKKVRPRFNTEPYKPLFVVKGKIAYLHSTIPSGEDEGEDFFRFNDKDVRIKWSTKEKDKFILSTPDIKKPGFMGLFFPMSYTVSSYETLAWEWVPEYKLKIINIFAQIYKSAQMT